MERFLGDLALERGWAFDPPPALSGRCVLVVGAGPSGLSAAYHLARLGHEVPGLLSVPAGTDEAGYERASYVTALQAANSHDGPW